MADSKPPEKQELSVEVRLLLAFILMIAVLYTTPYLFKSSTPPPTPAPDAKSTPVKAGQVAPAATPPPAAAPAPGQVAATAEETITVDTDLYQVVFSNRGAVVKSWILKGYKDSHQKQLELVNTAAAPATGYPFAFVFKNQKPDLNSALYSVK